MEQPQKIRIIRNSNEPNGEVCDFQTLQKWIEEGVVGAENQVWDPSVEKWVDAKKYAPIASLFSSSLWDAWEESSTLHLISDLRQEKQQQEQPPPSTEKDSVQPANDNLEELLDLSAEIESLPEISEADITPITDVSTSQNPLPSHLQTPVQVVPSTVRKPVKPTADPSFKKVSYATRSSHHATSREFHKEAQQDKSSIRWGRMAIILIPAILVIGFVNQYVISVASEVTPTDGEADILADGDRQKNIPKPQKLSAIEEQESSIRAKLPAEVMKVSKTKMLYDALFVQFNKMGLEVEIRTAEITMFGGYLGEQPERAIIHIQLKPQNEMFIIDLATAVLGVGQYIEHYGIEAKPFTIDISMEDGSIISQEIDPNLARKFYLGRATLQQFVAELK